MLVVVSSLFIQLFFPLVTKEFSVGNKIVIEQLSKQVTKWIFILNLPLFVLLFFFPGALINIFFGAKYIAAETALRLLSIGVFFYSFSIISENLLSMAGKSKIILSNILISSIINIILSVILTPKYGLNGAATATMVSYICLGGITMFRSIRNTSIIPVRRKMLRILFIMAIPTAILFLLRTFIKITPISMILLGLLFLLIYFVLILVTKCFDENDMMILSNIKRRYIR